MSKISRAALKAVHDRIIPLPVKIIEEGQEATPQVMLLNVDEFGDILNLSMMHPESCQAFFSDEAGKSQFATFLSGIVEPGNRIRQGFCKQAGFEPNLVVHVHEAWVVAQPLDTPSLGGVSPSAHPNRQECLICVMHTLHGAVPIMHFIEKGPPRKVKIAEFPMKESEGHLFAGRFVPGSI